MNNSKKSIKIFKTKIPQEDPQFESPIKKNLKVSSSTQPMALTLVPCRKVQSDKKIEQLETFSPESFKERVIYLLQVLFENDKTEFKETVVNHIQNVWNNLSMKIANRLNKITYMEPSFQYKNFDQIEKQIIHEWKRNQLLVQIQMLWNYFFKHSSFTNSKLIQNYYASFKKFVWQILYQLFRNCFLALEAKKYSVRQKISSHTAVLIITKHKEWKNIYSSKIVPVFMTQCMNFSENFDLKSLDIRKSILEVDSQAFQKTEQKIQKFILADTLEQKIDFLKQYRSTLLQEIKENIEEYEAIHGRSKHITVQKQDILSCIIFTLVKYRLDNIGVSLKYISLLLGAEIDDVLSFFQVNAYKCDLEAAYKYLTDPYTCYDHKMNNQVTLLKNYSISE